MDGVHILVSDSLVDVPSREVQEVSSLQSDVKDWLPYFILAEVFT